jgi:succinoglycan biosynthesis transport protein ExoP
MELNKFLRLLYKRWPLLIGVPIVGMAITYFLVRNLPASYTAQSTLATGLVDETRHTLSVGGISFQESQINQSFTNIVEMMKLKKMTDKVSFKLILHDLTQTPFGEPSKQMAALSAQDKKNSVVFFTDKYNKGEELNLFNKEDEGQYKLLKSMKYDEQSINSSLNIFRKSNSDYIQVEFTSENPELSPYVVNTLITEFIGSYDSIIKRNKGKTSDYLAELLRRKYAAMNEKIALLREYKIQNKILNLHEQSKILYTHMLLVDSRKMDAQKDIESYTGAIENIDSKFDPKDRKYLEGALTKLNQDILVTKTGLYALSDQYIASGYDPAVKAKLDSLKKKLDGQINSLTDQYIYDPLSSKKDLMTQKLSLEVERDLARNSLNGLTRESAAFNGRFDKLVPFEAVVQSYERDIDIASREYLDILNKYNQLGLDPDEPVKLAHVQVAMPGQGAPTKKIIFILAAGIISFALCVIILFVLFFFDRSLKTPTELAQATLLPVLGHLNKMHVDKVDLFALWNSTEASSPDFTQQKELLRSVRYEALQELGGKKVIAVASLEKGQGATFLAINLAYAFANMQKKVLLIDGNFDDSVIVKLLKPNFSIDQLFNGSYINASDFVCVAGSLSENRSPFEIASESNFKDLFASLPFDIIVIDAGNLEHDNNTKEWTAAADKLITVFESGRSLDAKTSTVVEWLRGNEKFAGWVMNKMDANKV